MKDHITLCAPSAAPATLKRSLMAAAISQGWADHGISIAPTEHRALDPTIQIALTNAAAAALGALLSGAFSVAVSVRATKVAIQRKDGSRIEFPASATKEQIQSYVDLLKDSAPSVIELGSEDKAVPPHEG